MRRLGIWSIVLTLTVTACGNPEAPGGEGTETVRAVASVFALAWIASQVAPDAGLTVLGQQGQEPHDLELSPGDREALQTADVVLYMGDIDFQPQVEAAVTSGEVVDVTSIVGDAALQVGAAHAHEGEEGEATVDPHIWFDPGLMAGVAERVGDAFAAADPANAQVYRDNATQVTQQLEALDEEIARMLSRCELDEAIVSHEAYAYLLQPHGLTQHGLSGVNPEAGGSPADLAELTVQIRAEGIPAVLAEPFEGRSDAEALAREAGVQLLEIDPLEVATPQQVEVGYPDLLRQQASTFATALRCAGVPPGNAGAA
ncbi:MAG: metal ABC transporter substrate-binding protein [Egibacteraceae bacterium]